MTNLNATRPGQNSFANTLASVVRSLLGNPVGLLAIAAGVIGFTAYSSWGWLVAAGLAPLLLSIAPCVAMCALGMCTMGMKSKANAPTEKVLPTDGKVGDHKDCC